MVVDFIEKVSTQELSKFFKDDLSRYKSFIDNGDFAPIYNRISRPQYVTYFLMNAGIDVLEELLDHGITKIPNFMFMGLDIKNIDILEGFTTIGESAFTDCTKLKRITLPHSLKDIEEYAADGIYEDQKVDIIYNGTVSDWQRVSIWQPPNYINYNIFKDEHKIIYKI